MTATSQAKTIGLFGGSFNPPHVAHVLAAGWALSAGGVDEIWVIPTGGHPFGKPLAIFEDRLDMCQLAFGCFGDRVRVLDVEREPRVHYSIDTVQRLREKHPDLRFRWITGSDALAQSGEWKDFDELTRLAPLLVVGRQGRGGDGSSFKLPDISSTLIRSALAQGASGEGSLDALLPRAVLEYIRKRGLYRES